MVAFNWHRVRASPILFTRLCALFAVKAVFVSIYRLVTIFKSHHTNFETALRCTLMVVFLGNAGELIYSAPPHVAHQSREINGVGFRTYEVAPEPGTKLKDADIVVYYFHGGGYYFGEALQYPKTFKRWKEKAALLGKRLAVVSLEYSIEASYVLV